MRPQHPAARAVVLARGLGTRMRQADPGVALSREQQRAADAGLKAMMPVNGRPFLDFVLSSLADAGLRHVALVVAPDHDLLRAYLSETPPSRVTLDFVVQEEALGTADALLAAERWTQREPFLALNADNLYPVDTLRALAAADEPAMPAFDADDLIASSNIPADRIGAFAFVTIDGDGYLTAIVEKPRSLNLPPEGGSHTISRDDLPPEGGSYTIARHDPPPEGGNHTIAGHDLPPEGGSHAMPGQKHVASAFRRKIRRKISMNCWRFDERIFDCCREVPKSARGELELPEAVGLAIARGIRIKAIPARGPVLDLSRRADAADVSRRLAGVVPCP